ncbi:uncharacterized protein MONBRDRAFT_35117 [Monosiga brevicollis MX1]|uniref:EF-hand domain-containing protein n=1 Tax=Monosiga brevicollis TaxID=81824 RepID=A9UX96_MONBE|nr:uncharacterized protein MONBRDRAFT_35117 [Monosiga brevicollis MX1]EDQ90181.1 predicted protein [Monosiga brevicollis MX1]|eukprot:XP_001744948.1 hypothetical protein [Monosiga brevicollis MX1]
MGHAPSKLKPEQIDALAKETKFTTEEIQQWFKAFRKDCPSGELSRKEFCRIYSQFFPAGNPEEFAEYVFRTFDKDANGKVNFREFMCAISVTSRGTVEQKLDWAFHLYDQNNDGFITREEMIAIVRSIYTMVADKSQLPEDVNTPEKRVEKIFSVMDTNHDDRLTREEFHAGAKKDPSIMGALSMCASNVSLFVPVHVQPLP